MRKLMQLHSLLILLILGILAPKVESQSTFTGNVFLDQNDDGIKNGSDYDHGVIRIIGYDDTDNSGTLNPGDLEIDRTLSDQFGNYSLILDANMIYTKKDSITRGDNDAEEEVVAGIVDFNSTDVELGYEGSVEQIVGLRFDNINIPKDAIISNAFIRFQAKQAHTSSPANINITGELSPSSAIFEAVNLNISDRDTTTASVNWVPGDWVIGNYYDSENISSILNEQVAQTGWTKDSPITILIDGSGEREAWSYNGNGKEPVLHVTYTQNFTGTNFLLAIDSNSIDSLAIISLPEANNHIFPTSSTSVNNVDFAFFGETVYCYGLSDDNANSGLSIMNRMTGDNLFVGLTGRNSVEATAVDSKTGDLYIADGGVIGILNKTTGAFSGRPNFVGSGQNSLGHNLNLNDIDGLTFDPFNGILWGAHRRGNQGDYDVLIQIDPVSGLAVQDAFGPGVEWVEIKNAAETLVEDIDDIAINPLTNELFAIANDRDSVDFDLLITIDKLTGLATVVDTIKDAAGNYIADVEGLGFTNLGILSAVTGDGHSSPNSIYNIDPTTVIGTFVGSYNYGDDYESCDCMTVAQNVASGILYEDIDGNQSQGAGENGLSGVSVYVYLDTNNDGNIDIGTDLVVDSVETGVDGIWSYTVGSNVDLLFAINESELPADNSLTTDNLEVALFKNGVGGDSDPANNFGYQSIPLPVTLLNFSVGQSDCFGELNWTSAIEDNFAFYEIQRSLDGKRYETIHTIFGQGGNFLKTYKFTDRLASATNFYRLKMVDLDQTFGYSEIQELSIDCDKFTSISMFPNPIHTDSDILNVEFFAKSEISKVVITDMLGIPVLEKEITTIAQVKNALQLEVGSLVAGTYTLQIEGNRFGQLFMVLE